MEGIRVIAFDLDGTLADTVDIHVKAWARAMGDLGRPPTKEEIDRYRRSVGKRLKEIMEDIYGNVDESFFEMVKNLKTRHFMDFIDEVRPIIGREVLESLAERYRLAIITSTTREHAIPVLDRLGIRDLFDVIISGEDVKEGKPSPEGILLLSKKLNVRPDEILYVGDTKIDEEAARRAGCKFVYIGRFLREWRSLL